MMRPLYIEDYNLICSLGDSRAQVWDRLVSGTRAGFVQKMFGEMQRYVATLDELPALLPVKNLFFDNRVNRISNKVVEPLRSSVEALAAKYGKDALPSSSAPVTTDPRRRLRRLNSSARRDRSPVAIRLKCNALISPPGSSRIFLDSQAL